MVAEGYHFAADATGHTGSALNLSPWSLQDGSLTRWGRGSGTNLTFGGSTYARPLADTPVAGISKDPDVRRQAVVNWQFSSIFQTSVGWESIQGGKPFAYGRASADKGDPKRLRATQSIILGNNARLVLDVTKTSVVVGPVKHATVGALRFVYGF